MDNSIPENWDPFAIDPPQRRLETVKFDGREVKSGAKVRLRPLGRADIMDIAMDGKMATVVSIEQDFEDRIHVAVTIDDDPGADFGLQGKPGHRFFFGIDEIEMDATVPAATDGT